MWRKGSNNIPVVKTKTAEIHKYCVIIFPIRYNSILGICKIIKLRTWNNFEGLIIIDKKNIFSKYKLKLTENFRFFSTDKIVWAIGGTI